jgi:hypothetical protein
MNMPIRTFGSESSEREALDAVVDHRDVGVDQGQRGERRGADREALADRRGGVADLVERVGDVRGSLAEADISAMPPALSATGP